MDPIAENSQNKLSACQNLLQPPKSISANFIFIFSQPAYSNSPSVYDKTKWLLEQSDLLETGVIVQPRLV
jgi:hypothetical protein